MLRQMLRIRFIWRTQHATEHDDRRRTSADGIERLAPRARSAMPLRRPSTPGSSAGSRERSSRTPIPARTSTSPSTATSSRSSSGSGSAAKRHDRFGTGGDRPRRRRHADLARTRTRDLRAHRERCRRSSRRRSRRTWPAATSPSTRSRSPCDPPNPLLDPFGGVADLAAGRLRVLHAGSFTDDPTRAIRAARYCARLGLAPEPETGELLRRDRPRARQRRSPQRRARPARRPSPTPPRASGCSREWGVLPLSDRALELIAAVDRGRCAPPPGATQGPTRGGGDPARCRRAGSVGPPPCGSLPTQPGAALGGRRARRAGCRRQTLARRGCGRSRLARAATCATGAGSGSRSAART